MDDRELEARLRTHLHQRFDDAQPSAELVANVRQGLQASVSRVGIADLRIRSPRVGWPAFVALAAVVIATVVAIPLGGVLSPGFGGSTPSPSAAGGLPLQRSFMVLADPASTLAERDEGDAGAVLTARLRAFGIDSVEVTFGVGWIELGVSELTLTDARIQGVLGANGDVEFVPLPADEYGTDFDIGPLVAQVGEPLPTDEPALFGSSGIVSIEIEEDSQGRRLLTITLTDLAAQRFADYTTGHVGEYFAVVLDGRVAAAPSINEPIQDGRAQLSFGTIDPGWEERMAILVGGPLPDGWRDPQVPGLLHRNAIVDRVLGELAASGAGGATPTVREAWLEAIRAGAVWRPVWKVYVDGKFRECGGAPSGDAPCLEALTMEYLLDAETGEVISSRVPPPGDGLPVTGN